MKSKGYYINIVKIDEMWYFQLCYRGKQAMGNSIGYKNIEECKIGLKNFQRFLLDTTDIIENEDLLKIKNTQDNKYVYKFLNKEGKLLYKSRYIEAKVNCKNSAESTCKNLPNIIEFDRIKIIKE